jgi:hypothetical protein
MARPLQAITEAYPRRGPMQQYRMETATAFHCFRCGAAKKSKLLTVYASDWNKLLCNGCYGRLLSIYDIKAGTGPDEEKSEALADLLLAMVSEDQVRRAAERARISERRAVLLSPQAVRFISTAEYVAGSLDAGPSLDWSPAVIGLCKALELELVQRVIEPLRRLSASADLSADISDKDLGRVARYCSGRMPVPPEIGAIRHFLQTAAHSRERIGRSQLLQSLKRLLSDWPRSPWLLDDSGALAALSLVTARFRNRAAHTDELTKADYQACFDLVAGDEGILWTLVSATADRKQAGFASP